MGNTPEVGRGSCWLQAALPPPPPEPASAGAPRSGQRALCRVKYWSCCGVKTTDFSTFLEQPGCSRGRHCWAGKGVRGLLAGGSSVSTVRLLAPEGAPSLALHSHRVLRLILLIFIIATDDCAGLNASASPICYLKCCSCIHKNVSALTANRQTCNRKLHKAGAGPRHSTGSADGCCTEAGCWTWEKPSKNPQKFCQMTESGFNEAFPLQLLFRRDLIYIATRCCGRAIGRISEFPVLCAYV